MDMGREIEVEDDLFFADLSKRISLMITEEEDKFPGNYPDVSFQGYYPQTQLPFFAPPLSYTKQGPRPTGRKPREPASSSHVRRCRRRTGGPGGQDSRETKQQQQDRQYHQQRPSSIIRHREVRNSSMLRRLSAGDVGGRKFGGNV